MESLDDHVQPPSTMVRVVGRFQPKDDSQSKNKKFVTPANAVHGVGKSLGTSSPISSSFALDANSSELRVTQGPVHATEEPIIHTKVSQDGTHVSEGDINLQTDPDKSISDETAMLHGMGSLDDALFQPNATSVKKVGKFQPKLVSRPKERKAKSVSFVLPAAAAETVSLPVESHSEVLACDSTGVDPSFLEMMSDVFLDKTPHSSSVVSDCNVDSQMDHGRLEKEDTAEFSDLESLDNILSQPTLTTDPARGKFQPKPSARTKNVKPNASIVTHGAAESLSSQWDSLPAETESLEGHKSHDPGFPDEPPVCSVSVWTCSSMSTDLCHEQANLIEMSTLEAASPGSNEVLQTIDRTSGDNYIGGKRKLSPSSKDTSNGAQSQNVEELTHKILDERPTTKSVEDDGASKSSRKLRKRIDMCRSSVELDDTTSEDWDVENSNISHMDEEHSDDEYRGEDMPKQKRATKKSKGQMTENNRPAQKHKASEEPDSTVQEPQKKKFPHSTRRKRRQVNKVLLETPEYEIDPRQLSIKDLIMLAEAKERTSNQEAAALRKSFPNQSNTSSFRNDTHLDKGNHFGEEHYQNCDDAEGNHNIQPMPTKLNYHSYMNRQQSGRWSKQETELFYQAIRQFGTDFAMIQQLFPNRTRHQVKLKFKNEERKHPLQVADAIVHRSKDHSHFERVIQQLQAQAEQNSRVETNGDPSTVTQDAADGNEEESREPHKQEDQEAANGFKGEAQSPVKYNDCDGDVESPANNYGFETGKEKHGEV